MQGSACLVLRARCAVLALELNFLRFKLLQACRSRRLAFAQPADKLEQQIAGIIAESQFHDPCVAKCIEKGFGSPSNQLISAAYHYQLEKNVANAAQMEAFICKAAPTRGNPQNDLTLGLQVQSSAKEQIGAHAFVQLRGS